MVYHPNMRNAHIVHFIQFENGESFLAEVFFINFNHLVLVHRSSTTDVAKSNGSFRLIHTVLRETFLCVF